MRLTGPRRDQFARFADIGGKRLLLGRLERLRRRLEVQDVAWCRVLVEEEYVDVDVDQCGQQDAQPQRPLHLTGAPSASSVCQYGPCEKRPGSGTAGHSR